MLAFYMLLVEDIHQKTTLESIYHQYRKQMFCLARSILGSDADAEDAVHDVFVRIATRHMAAVLRISDANDLRNYLLKAVKNTCLNYKRRREIPTDPDDAVFAGAILSDDAFVDMICAKAQKEQLLQAMISLPAPYRDVLYFRFVLEFSVAEIAKMQSVKMETIRKQLMRGKKKLLEALDWTGGAPVGNHT